MSGISQWMSWSDGVDLVALTSPDLQMPNVIVHLGGMVHTPVGSAPSGMILWQPDPKGPPSIMGFVSSDSSVGAYFGPNIFAGTPFEQAPVLNASIKVVINGKKAISRCEVGGFLFEVEMSDFSAPYLINRKPSDMPPFWQQGVEMSCSKTILKINRKVIDIIIPPMGITGGPASVVSPNGVYAR